MLKFSVAFCFITTFAVVFTVQLDEVLEEISFEEDNHGKIYAKSKNGTQISQRAEYMTTFRDEGPIYLLTQSNNRYWARFPEYEHRSNPFTADVRRVALLTEGPIAAKFTDGHYAYELDVDANLRKYAYKPGFNEDLLPSKEPLIQRSGVDTVIVFALGASGSSRGHEVREKWSSYLNSGE